MSQLTFSPRNYVRGGKLSDVCTTGSTSDDILALKDVYYSGRKNLCANSIRISEDSHIIDIRTCINYSNFRISLTNDGCSVCKIRCITDLLAFSSRYIYIVYIKNTMTSSFNV
jgi:hypothetical protein